MRLTAVAERLVPVILAGGSGTRLWPLSRPLYPKQFLSLVGDRSMLQETLRRLQGLTEEPPLILCNEEHRFIVAEQCRQANAQPASIILEPVARGTAPAVALAALSAAHEDDPLLLVLSADAHVGSNTAFIDAVTSAAPVAAAGKVVLFGATPTRPETGFGYIQVRTPSVRDGVHDIAAFVEKPTRTVAEDYVASGDHLWNCGMFLMRASVYLAELAAFRPGIVQACRAAHAARASDLAFTRPGAQFEDCPAASVDRAVMENTSLGVVVATDMGWSDVGSWDALAALAPADAAGNATAGDVIAFDTEGSYLLASHRLVATLGLRDMVVVETSDAVLVATRERAQDVRALVDALARDERPERRSHATVYRPWGHAETIKADAGFLVKRLTVAPGQSLSLQRHQRRSEHWVVVSGEADVVRGDDRLTLHSDESTYLPVGIMHRLSNRGDEPLVVIEVQVGDQLSEDDIERFDDQYGRVPRA